MSEETGCLGNDVGKFYLIGIFNCTSRGLSGVDSWQRITPGGVINFRTQLKVLGCPLLNPDARFSIIDTILLPGEVEPIA